MSILNYKKVPIDDILTLKSYEFVEESSKMKQLRLLLNRFKKKDILTAVNHIVDLSNKIHAASQKNMLIHYILKFIEETSLDINDIILKLHLKYMQFYPKTRKWKALVVVNAKRLVTTTLCPKKFMKILGNYLSLQNYHCDFHSEKIDNTIWTILKITKKRLKFVVFFLSYVQLPLVVYNCSNTIFEKALKELLINLFKGRKVKILNIKSKYLDSVAYYGYQKCQDEGDDDLPSQFQRDFIKRNAKMKATLPENIINHNIQEEGKREDYLKRTFGEFQMLPLECLTYNVTSFIKLKDEEIPFKSTIVFKGENVLEGMQNLVESGIAEIPLPAFLTDPLKSGRTEYNLKVTTIEHHD